MRLKSYFVHTMEEALQAAKTELGDEAMLVDSKRLQTPPEGRPRLEVIFAVSATPPPPPRVAPPPPEPLFVARRTMPTAPAAPRGLFPPSVPGTLSQPAKGPAPGVTSAPPFATVPAALPSAPDVMPLSTFAAATPATPRGLFPPVAGSPAALPSAPTAPNASPRLFAPLTELPAAPAIESQAAAGGAASAAAFSAAPPAADLRRFRGELVTLLDALNHQPCTARLGSLSPAAPHLDAIRAKLLTSEVPAPAIEEALALLRPPLESLVLNGQATEASVTRAAIPLLAAEWAPWPPVRTVGPRTIALVGPTGAGKTSAIAKLAFHLGVLAGRTVSVFSVDNLRIGASDQLAHLCSLLGVSFEPVENSATLPTRVAAHQHAGVILIDTPGYGAADSDIAADTAACLRRIESLECHLTLPATLRYREMQRRREQFSVFAPSHLLFTRLDETEFFGPAWALARESRLPVEWVSTGPGIPEDLDGADALRVASAILSHAPYSAELKLSQNLASAAKAGASRI